MIKKFKKEKGQSLVEFALILPIIILIVMIPVDIFRCINSKILLSGAASECINGITYDDICDGSVENKFLEIMNKNYSDMVDISKVNFSFMCDGTTEKKDYTFYVYSSDKANPDSDKFWQQFESRPSNYTKLPVKLKLRYKIKPATFWGAMIFGDSIQVNTKMFVRQVFASGFEP